MLAWEREDAAERLRHGPPTPGRIVQHAGERKRLSDAEAAHRTWSETSYGRNINRQQANIQTAIQTLDDHQAVVTMHGRRTACAFIFPGR